MTEPVFELWPTKCCKQLSTPGSSRLTEKGGVALRLVTCFQEYTPTITTPVIDIFGGFPLSLCVGSGKYLQVYHSLHVYTIEVLF
jgi:hypothetical protein